MRKRPFRRKQIQTLRKDGKERMIVGAIWKFAEEKRLNVSAGLNYRAHPLVNPIKFTRTDNSTDQLTNLNSMIFQINMSYKF